VRDDKDKSVIDVDSREDQLGATWLASRYQVAGLRAHGAYCLVYQGQDAILQRPVAIKAPFAEHAENYRATLPLTATLAHPAFVALYDVIEQIEQGAGLFLAYEFVEGRPLTDYITSGLPLRRALDVMAQVTRALVYAHAHGVTHGDLTPAALLVDRSATARIANVGLPPDDAYFDEIATSAYNSGVADDPDTTALRLTNDAEWLDTWAVAVMLWQLVTDASGERGERGERDDHPDTEKRVRGYRADTPDELRDLLERTLRVSHSEPISTATALEERLAALSASLASSTAQEEPTPAMVLALRAEKHGADGVAQAAPVPGVHWRARGARSVSATAITGYGEVDGAQPGAHDENRTLPSHERARPQRLLTLPSRPMGAPSSGLLDGSRVAMGEANAQATPPALAARGGLSAWVWALILVAIFALCFLIGFSLVGIIPLAQLP
jgi:hypothetical protein